MVEKLSWPTKLDLGNYLFELLIDLTNTFTDQQIIFLLSEYKIIFMSYRIFF